MAEALLGPAFEIHGGGLDLVFPHHENELAQSACAHPEGSFASIWMHNGFLNVEGEKMSKSLGNFFTVRDLLDRSIPGEVMRFVLLSTHYRAPMDLTEEKVEEAKATLRRWRDLTATAGAGGEIHASLLEALSDDLNTPQAIALLHQLASAGDADTLVRSAHVLGLLTPDLAWGEIDDRVRGLVTLLVEKRDTAPVRRDFPEADRLRDQLVAAGVVLMDRTGGSTQWRTGPDFDPSTLEALE
jgi:cysteinyl-tRNA synthetase